MDGRENAVKRTRDVYCEDGTDFEALCVADHIIKGLVAHNITSPSPIQYKAIPLGRCGLDLVVQAKSGTGKTVVYTCLSLEAVKSTLKDPQVLVLTPTREIAIQVTKVIQDIGCHGNEMTKVCHFIGGVPLSTDKKALKCCQIAVGTPGRIKQLIEMKALKTSKIRMFILDEADKLIEENLRAQINFIYWALPENNKQILALSATYPESLAKLISIYMKTPTFVRLDSDSPSLLGIKHYYSHIDDNFIKTNDFSRLHFILQRLAFKQGIIFCNNLKLAESIHNYLTSKTTWPTAIISGGMDQKKRTKAFSELTTQKCSLLVSTDVAARGIDSAGVNLVVNLDIPQDPATYLHRVGRAGRFGTNGVALNLLSESSEIYRLFLFAADFSFDLQPLPEGDSLVDLLSTVNSSPKRIEKPQEVEETEMVPFLLGAVRPPMEGNQKLSISICSDLGIVESLLKLCECVVTEYSATCPSNVRVPMNSIVLDKEVQCDDCLANILKETDRPSRDHLMDAEPTMETCEGVMSRLTEMVFPREDDMSTNLEIGSKVGIYSNEKCLLVSHSGGKETRVSTRISYSDEGPMACEELINEDYCAPPEGFVDCKEGFILGDGATQDVCELINHSGEIIDGFGDSRFSRSYTNMENSEYCGFRNFDNLGNYSKHFGGNLFKKLGSPTSLNVKYPSILSQWGDYADYLVNAYRNRI